MTKHCLYCKRPFVPKTKRRQYCYENGDACKQAHYRLQKNPLTNSAASLARRAAWLEQKQYGTVAKPVRRELARRGLLPPLFGGDAEDTDQDSTTHYDMELRRELAARKQPKPAYESRSQVKGPWEDATVWKPADLDPDARSVQQYLRAVDRAKDSPYPLIPVMEVVLWHANLVQETAQRYIDLSESPSELAVFMARLEVHRPGGYIAKRERLRLHKNHAERDEMTPAIMERLDRIELLESMRAETMDSIRETVEKIAARYPDDQRIQEQANILLDDDSV